MNRTTTAAVEPGTEGRIGTSGRPANLDHAATSPLLPGVRGAMEPYRDGRFANPASRHTLGRSAAAALDGARGEIADVLGVRPSEVYFTSGGTEGNNWAVRRRVGIEGGCVVTTGLEHPSVFHAASTEASWDHLVVGFHPEEGLDLPGLREGLTRGASLVSVMAVSNETGVELPLDDVAELTREFGVPLHCDAVQAGHTVFLDQLLERVDLATFSGHKLGGPRGVGVSIVREGVELRPLLYGGGQERGLRPGTVDVAGAVGFAAALKCAQSDVTGARSYLEGLRDFLEEGIVAGIPDARVHHSSCRRSPHISHIGFPGVDSDLLMMRLDLDGIAASNGSACSSGSKEPSRALQSLYPGQNPPGAVRFSFSTYTSEQEIDAAIRVTVSAVRALREVRS